MLFLHCELIKLDERSIKMKKLFLLITLLGLTTLPLVAQEDDMYYVSPKAVKKAKTKKAYDDSKPAYYVGSNRNVDEYNRRKITSSYQKIGVDSLGNDIIQLLSENDIYPDTSYVDTMYMVSKYINKDDDYRYTRDLTRWNDYYYYGMPYDIWRYYSWPSYMYGRLWGWDYYNYYNWYYGGYYGYYNPWFYDYWFGYWYPWGYPGWGGWYGYYPYYNHTVYYGGGYGHGGHNSHHSNTYITGSGDIRNIGSGTHNHSIPSANGGSYSVHSSSNHNAFSRSGSSGRSTTASSATTRSYTTSNGMRFGGSRAYSNSGSSSNYSSYSTPSYSSSSSYSSGSSGGYSGGSSGASFSGSSSSGGGGGGGGGRSGGGGGGGGGSFGGHR